MMYDCPLRKHDDVKDSKYHNGLTIRYTISSNNSKRADTIIDESVYYIEDQLK